MNLTATPLPDRRAVRLEVDTAAAGAVTITRADRNGTDTVRQYATAETSAGALAVVDYEAAVAGPLTYTATDTAGSTATASTSLDLVGVVVVAAVGRPNLRAEVEVLSSFDESSATAGTYFDPIDRTDPIIVERPMRTPRGSLELLADTYLAARTAADVVAAGMPILLRQSGEAGVDALVTAEGYRVEFRPSATLPPWSCSVTFRRRPSPTTPLLASYGWTIADVADAYATIADVADAFATVADLEAGP